MSERTCEGLTSAHDAVDPQEMYLHHGLWPLPNAVLCRGCRTRLIDSGWDWRPERRDHTTRPRVRPRFSLRRAA